MNFSSILNLVPVPFCKLFQSTLTVFRSLVESIMVVQNRGECIELISCPIFHMGRRKWWYSRLMWESLHIIYAAQGCLFSYQWMTVLTTGTHFILQHVLTCELEWTEETLLCVIIFNPPILLVWFLNMCRFMVEGIKCPKAKICSQWFN